MNRLGSRTTWLVIGAMAAVVVLLLGITLVVVNRGGDEQASTPQAAVTAFLQALAAGDSDRALSGLSDPPSSELLTAPALRMATAAAPITDISVAVAERSGFEPAPASPTASETSRQGTDIVSVRAQFRVGSVATNATYSVTRSGSRWLVTDGLAEVIISSTTIPGLTLQGVTIGAGASVVTVFPGALLWGSSSPYLRVISGDSAESQAASPPPIVTGGQSRAAEVRLTAALSEQGASAVKAAMQAHFTRCARSHQADASVDEQGCTQRLYRSATPGSVRWTPPESLADLVTEVDQTHPLSVAVFGSAAWTADYTATYGGTDRAAVDVVIDGTVDLSADPPAYAAAGAG